MDKIKIVGYCLLSLLVGLVVGYFVIKHVPDVELKTQTIAVDKKETKEELEKTKIQLNSAKFETDTIKKKLAQATEINKNINIKELFDKDGHLISRETIDLSKLNIKKDSESTSTSTSTVTFQDNELVDKLTKQLAEEKSKTTTTDKTVYHTAGIGLAINPLNAINEFGAGGSIIIFNNIQLNGILVQKNIFKEINPLLFIQYLF